MHIQHNHFEDEHDGHGIIIIPYDPRGETILFSEWIQYAHANQWSTGWILLPVGIDQKVVINKIKKVK
jgi:hypothetical protein